MGAGSQRKAGPATTRRRLAAGAAGLLAAPSAARAAGEGPVDLALVLATDASGSIDQAEFRFQKEGIAQSLADPAVLAAIRAGLIGRIAVAYLEWGSPGGARPVVAFMPVEDAASAAAFGSAVLEADRTPQSYNAIGDAIETAASLLAASPFEATRSVIDVSGDASDMRSIVPAEVARDRANAAGITINALAIGSERLAAAYERQVIGGFGAFVVTAASRADFAQALRRKLIREIA